MSQEALTSDQERSLAGRLFNEAWSLLDKADRSPTEDDRLIHLAHASRLHWDKVGTDQHRAVGEWQCSRVYATLGRGEAAVHHARRCAAYADSDGVEPWVRASAREGLARALVTAGDLEGARSARAEALALAEALTDADDRAVVVADIETLPFS